MSAEAPQAGAIMVPPTDDPSLRQFACPFAALQVYRAGRRVECFDKHGLQQDLQQCHFNTSEKVQWALDCLAFHQEVF